MSVILNWSDSPFYLPKDVHGFDGWVSLDYRDISKVLPPKYTTRDPLRLSAYLFNNSDN